MTATMPLPPKLLATFEGSRLAYVEFGKRQPPSRRRPSKSIHAHACLEGLAATMRSLKHDGSGRSHALLYETE